jgi:predicted nuclease of restriction endonuclease-like (RecB) superfamily
VQIDVKHEPLDVKNEQAEAKNEPHEINETKTGMNVKRQVKLSMYETKLLSIRNFVVDETILRNELKMTNFDKYAVEPGYIF